MNFYTKNINVVLIEDVVTVTTPVAKTKSGCGNITFYVQLLLKRKRNH